MLMNYMVKIMSTDEESKHELVSELHHVNDQLKSAKADIAYLLERVATYRRRWLEDYYRADNLERHMPYGVYVPDLGQIPEDTASPKLLPDCLACDIEGSQHEVHICGL
ncbi:hypothetical protein EDD22DRAFT_848662 [Suillus occidentalis]|nr:hypothetical protein EDD22DRAFT_855460 [Suillus occidentalis]KAG1760184.1 hypothetical protein EDD22DRAFT_848662 [Suillus occidentalis]